MVEDRRHFNAYDDIEALRHRYLHSDRTLELHDAGAGSRVARAGTRTIADICRTSATPPRFGRYLFATVDQLRASNVLELGSNLGIGACYLAAAMPSGGRLVTIDADPALAACARTALARTVPRASAEVLVGTFAARLPEALAALGRVDVAFVDGHHDEHATLGYVAQIRAHCHAGSILILDDIHWSTGMERAWTQLRQQDGVSLSIDLYRWGILFFDPGVRRAQHLTIAPWRWKPWHMGFFTARQTRSE